MIELLIGLSLLIVLIICGVPVAMSFGAMALYFIFAFDVSSAMLVPTAFSQIKSVVLLSIPFFILIGNLMSSGGLAARLISFVNSIAGYMRGGLGAVAVIACALFGSIGGSCSAAVAAIGTIIVPQMEKSGYPRNYSTALVACSSILGQLIPPSIAGIMYALLTYQSIPGCWLATVGPGILTIIIFCIINFVLTRKMKLVVPPPLPPAARVKEFAVSTKKASLALLLPILLLGSIYGGLATPTEAACLAVIYVIFISRYATREITWGGIGGSVIKAASTTGSLVLMLFFIMMNTRILVFEQLPQEMARAILEISDNKIVILLAINFFLLIIGMIMDDISGTVLAASLLFPVMQELGVHPLHFAAILGVNLGMGNVTPPTAPILYMAGHITGCRVAEYLKYAMIFILCGLLPVIIATTYWPSLSLFLPGLFGMVN
ncbi:TRAP transporter large permease [Deltaproteobacteria bacterium OttesenSCG-928-K17]|nr:TRAP transporter large permease [Deltaproteobacteria bacterium OttesenSCG-928-K17]